MISDYLSMAFKNMKNRRLRTFLTLLGIIISIATIFVLISVSIGLQDAIQSQFQALGGDKFFIQPRGQFGPPGSDSVASELNQEDIDEINKISGVKETTFWIIANAKTEFNKELRFVQVAGLNEDNIQLSLETGNYKLDEGRFLEEGDYNEVVLGSQYKYNNVFSKPLKIRDRILINDKEFRVKGILKTVGNPSDDRLIYMLDKPTRELFDIPERMDFIIVQVDTESNINQIANSVERKLLKSRGIEEENQDFTILTPEELLESFSIVLNIITSFLFGVSAISLLVGGINIANAMFTSVLERTREIGVMKAIGAKNNDILLIFLIESGLLGLVGGVVGVMLGYGISQGIEYIALTKLATTILQTSSPPYLIIGSLAFAFLAGAISGIYPAWQATRIKPVEALRYE